MPTKSPSGIRPERILELITLRTAKVNHSLHVGTDKQVTVWSPEHAALFRDTIPAQFRAGIIADNLSTPIRPRSLKAPLAKPQQARSDSRERTYSAPSDMGRHSARFVDPNGAVFKAKTERKTPERYDPLWVGFPGTSDRQPDGALWHVDCHAQQQARWRVYLEARYQPNRYPSSLCDRTLTPVGDTTPSAVYAVPRCQPITCKPSKAVEPFQNVLEPHPAPVTYALPLPTRHLEPQAWNHPKPKTGLTVTVVSKPDPETIVMDCPTWNGLTIKRLFERHQDTTRKGRKRNTYRLVPKNPSTRVYALFA